MKNLYFVFVLFVLTCFCSCSDASTTKSSTSGGSDANPNSLTTSSPAGFQNQSVLSNNNSSTPESSLIIDGKYNGSYYDYLISVGEIEIEASMVVGGGVKKYNVNDLFYYLDDFNYDGTVDLAISAEKSDSNGIEIYSNKDGQITQLLSKNMPHSAGMEIYTLARYDGKYGIKHYRHNSIGEFAFVVINKDATREVLIEGWYYDIDGNVLDKSTCDKIEPIFFYGIEELKNKC